MSEAELRILEMWENAKFGPTESAARFGELLGRVSAAPDAGEGGIEMVARIGEIFADAGRADEVLVAAEHLRGVFRTPVSSDARDRIGEILVSFGGRLLDQGLPGPAASVAAMTESLLDGATSGALEVSLALAMQDRVVALKQQAFASGDGALMTTAVEVGMALEARFTHSPDPNLSGIADQASYNVAGALAALNRIDEAAARFLMVAEKYRGHHPDSRLHNLGQYAAVRHQMMLSIPDPPPYLVEHSLETSYRADAQEFEAPGGWRERRDNRLDAAARSHEAAAAILARYRLAAEPFVLFLRSFDAEGWAAMTGPAFEIETDMPAQVVSVTTVAPLAIEQQLTEAVGGRGEVLAIANRNSLSPSSWLVPRLFLPDDGWQAIAEALIRAAHFIVLHVGEFTPGVRWELDRLRACQRSSATVIVIQDGDAEVQTRGFLDGLRLFASIERTVDSASEETTALAGFDRVVRESAIPGGQLIDTPVASDLLESMHSVSALDPEARLDWLVWSKSRPSTATRLRPSLRGTVG